MRFFLCNIKCADFSCCTYRCKVIVLGTLTNGAVANEGDVNSIKLIGIVFQILEAVFG